MYRRVFKADACFYRLDFIECRRHDRQFHSNAIALLFEAITSHGMLESELP